MAAQDLRTNANFSRLPTTIRDARGQFMYIRFPAGVFDTGTGLKQICNLPKGTRVIDAKVGVTTALVGTTWSFSLKTFDGSTTVVLMDVATTTAVVTVRAPGGTATNPPEALVNGTSNQLQIDVTTATAVTTTPAFVLTLTLARENT